MEVERRRGEKKNEKNSFTPLRDKKIFGIIFGVKGKRTPNTTRTTKDTTKERNKKMATGNFKTMTDFPLIVSDDIREKICPECGLGNCEDADKCEECGCDLSEVETVIDDFLCAERTREMEKVAAALNEAQPFYNVTVESGYYSGVQFYVDEKYWKIEEMDNEESRSEFDMCRSKMLRKYKVAGNTIRKRLRKAADELGLDELLVAARFSSGETWYSKVDPKKGPTLRQAVKAAIAAA